MFLVCLQVLYVIALSRSVCSDESSIQRVKVPAPFWLYLPREINKLHGQRRRRQRWPFTQWRASLCHGTAPRQTQRCLFYTGRHRAVSSSCDGASYTTSGHLQQAVGMSVPYGEQTGSLKRAFVSEVGKTFFPTRSGIFIPYA